MYSPQPPFPFMEEVLSEERVKKTINEMGGGISGGNFLDGNFPGGNFPGGSLMGGSFPGGNFPWGSFHRTFFRE